MHFLFWNLNKNTGLAAIVGSLAVALASDVVALAENKVPDPAMLAALGPAFRTVPTPKSRVSLFTRLPIGTTGSVITMLFEKIRQFVVSLAIAATLAGIGPQSRPVAGKLVCVGDSITAGEGISKAECFVGRLQARAAVDHLNLKVVNQGRSGWTTGGYVQNAKKVVAAMPADATTVLIFLGTNDARSKESPAKVAEAAATNVEKLIALYRGKAPAAKFVVAAPTAVFPEKLSDRLKKADYGPRTVTNLKAIALAYKSTAEKLGVEFVDLSAVPSSAGNSIDGVHPNAAGHAELAEAIWAGVFGRGPATTP